MRPTWGQLRQFCITLGYQERRGDHDRYIKIVSERDTSGTMISHGVDGQTIPTQLWVKVWKRQLRLVSEDEFWKGLDGGPVQYDIPPMPAPSTPLPQYLVVFLRDTLHRSAEQIESVGLDQAQELLNAHHARALRDP
jgi:hypothetical protein